MLRFLLAVLVGGVLVLGYDWVFAAEPTPPRSVENLDPVRIAATNVTAESEPIAEEPAVAEPQRTEEAAMPTPALHGTPRPTAAALDNLLVELQEGVPGAITRAHKILAAGIAPGRERLAALLLDASAVTDAEATVRLLGDTNDFLHSEDGRRIARSAIDKAGDLEPEKAALTLTRLIELCMKGEIERSDVEPRAVVEEAYAALKPQLMRTVLDPANLARSKSYAVKPGDALSLIARSLRKDGHKLEAGTLAAFNRISNPKLLRAGQILKVPVDEIYTVLEKRSFLQAVYVGDVIFRLYWVAHGKDDCTPETTFTIGTKKEHPDWYAEGRVIPYGHPDNVLGDYFVKFDHESYTGFGVHGTTEPQSIGTMASAGCVRMLDADIEDYFNVIPIGTRFIVRASR